jgi:hypothetical protein
MEQLKRISHKQSARWQHLSRLKASAFFSLQKKSVVKKCNNLYLVLVTSFSGWMSPIKSGETYNALIIPKSFITLYRGQVEMEILNFIVSIEARSKNDATTFNIMPLSRMTRKVECSFYRCYVECRYAKFRGTLKTWSYLVCPFQTTIKNGCVSNFKMFIIWLCLISAPVRHLCWKTSILSCHRCLIPSVSCFIKNSKSNFLPYNHNKHSKILMIRLNLKACFVSFTCLLKEAFL